MTDSGSNEIKEDDEEIVSIYEKEDTDEYEYEDLPNRLGKKKKKINNVEYGKVAAAIGKFQYEGIEVTLPDINHSDFTFSVDEKNNRIIYGLRGISRISTSLIKDIIENRPYSSLKDLLSKVNIKKTQVINLIKSGAFDNIEPSLTRQQIMYNYVDSNIEYGQSKLTLQNMPTLISMNLIPEEYKFYKKVFLFNKFLKKNKDGVYYVLNLDAINFIVNVCEMSDIIYDGDRIIQKKWDAYYTKIMEPMREFIKNNSGLLTQQIRSSLIKNELKKYGEGNDSKYEMEAVGFYSKKHELDYCNQKFINYFDLPEEPMVDNIITTREGYKINIYKLSLIAGTVLDKNKMKNTVTILTQDGVVTVKIYKNQFALYDKQISVKNPDGTKTVLEKSWFQKGTILMLQGFRRNQEFVLKKYKNSVYPVITKFELDDNNNINMVFDRIESE